MTINNPVIIPQSEHSISRSAISANALKVLGQLQQAGYVAYLVGGCVRDLLLGREPKDFDVATNAHPEQIKNVFGRQCRLIGRRFRLAHVRFGREIIEVATFRAQHSGEQEGGVIQDGMILRDNVFGTLEEDAWRRDFSVNALYFNSVDFSVIDFVGGVADLDQGLLRLIGDPEQRYREDPVRMLRAIRFMAKLGLRLHPDTEAPIVTLASLLRDIPSSRLFEEVLKLFQAGVAVQTFELLRHYGVFGALFPATEHCLQQQRDHYPLTLLIRALASTDSRIQAAKPVTPAFLFAALWWEPVRQLTSELQAAGETESQAMLQAIRQVMPEQARLVALPKRFATRARDIWLLQLRLQRTSGRRAMLLLEHVSFRAAYDFLLLRAEAGEPLQELGEWWTQFQLVDEEQRIAMCRQGKQRPRRRRRKPKSKTSGE